MESKYLDHDGDVCPLPPLTWVEVYFRNGTYSKGKAEDYLWFHETWPDIMKYRLLGENEIEDTQRDKLRAKLAEASYTEEWVTTHGTWSKKGNAPKSQYVYEMTFKLVNGHPDWDTVKVKGK